MHDYLAANGIWAEGYIREEFDWIRSALPFTSRDDYLNIERQGRAFPMQRKHRLALLDGLKAWERKMSAVGVTDYLGLATALSRHESKLCGRYRCTIIDESQDLGTTELALLRDITKEGENDILVCGDAAQRVSTKFQSLKSAGVRVPSVHSNRIMKNYRNSREILIAAYNTLFNNLSEEVMGSEDFELLDPEYSNFSGATPLLLGAGSLEVEISAAVAFAQGELRRNSNWKSCIAICGYSLHEIKNYVKELNGRVLDGSTHLSDGDLFFSDLEQTKGFEFDLMIVVNASQSILPNPLCPKREQYRDLTQFYVAMTRAKSQLVVSYSGASSPLLDESGDDFLADTWESYLGELPPPVRKPQRLETFRGSTSSRKEILFMSGPEFLHTPNALGLSPLLIQKLRQRIPGNPAIINRSYTAWSNIGSAYLSLEEDVRSRQAFGPRGAKEFRDLCDSLNIKSMVDLVPRNHLF